MKEYYGEGAKTYAITERKQHVLFPAVERSIPSAQPGQKLLDLACGNGAFHDMVVAKGYRYVGLDISPDMIAETKQRFPDGEYIVEDAVHYADTVKEQYDVILSILLLPSLSSYQAVEQTLESCQKTLTIDGKLILGIVNPYFTQYMLVGMFNKPGIKTKFEGYYKTGAKFEFTKEFPNGTFTFEDYHYTLTDFFKAIAAAGLKVDMIDECPPPAELRETNPELYEKYNLSSGYMILICSHVY